MPTNRIVVERENGVVKLTVWDSAGASTDCSSIFEEAHDLTALGRASCALALKANSLQTNVKFSATKKELVYDVEPGVVEQVLQMIP